MTTSSRTEAVYVVFTVYRAATNVPRWDRPRFNRYNRVIGAALTVAGWVVSLQWRRP